MAFSFWRFCIRIYELENGLFLMAIWYNKIPSKTIIWFANGDNLAPQGSKLELDEHRGLVLSSPRDQELWKSQSLSSRISFGLMNNTGNFQLLNQNSEVLWESFEHPSDTLVPTQTMELNGKLSSRRSETNFSKGKFQLRLAEDGNAVLNPINFRSNFSYPTYNSSGNNDYANINNSGYGVIFDELGLYILRRNGEKVNITDLDHERPVDEYYYKATINYDGVFTVSYHPKDSSVDGQKWTVSKTIPDYICPFGADVGTGICGFNSICSVQSDGRPKCKCLDGYSLVDATDELSTCLPDLELGGREGEDKPREGLYHMTELPKTNFPGGDYESYQPSTIEECKDICLKDCQCAVAALWDGGCWLKKLPLSYGRNDDMLERGTILVKVMKDNNVSQRIPDIPFPSEKTNTKDQDTTIKVITILLGSSFFFNITLVAIICVTFFVKFHKRIRANKTVNDSNLRSFTYQELVKATENFKNELGRGSCGIVYKGEIEMGQMTSLAVKKLDKILQDSDKEFKAEVSIIGRTHHKNLVRLLGYCDEGQHRILVYEFLSNGTLASFLFGELKPSWNQRIHIHYNKRRLHRREIYRRQECSVIGEANCNDKSSEKTSHSSVKVDGKNLPSKRINDNSKNLYQRQVVGEAEFAKHIADDAQTLGHR